MKDKMAAPKLVSAVIQKESPTEVILYFDNALDCDLPIPINSFSVNFGKYLITEARYDSNSIIVLVLENEILPTDEVFLTYEPPVELSEALRRPVKDPSNLSQIKRVAVRQVSNFEINNLLETTDRKEKWASNSNLAGSEESGIESYPNIKRGNPQDPTPDDYILMFGLKEAIQISNIDDASATSPNKGRIWLALEDACALIDSYVYNSTKSCFKIVSSNRRRTACIIARYYLDSVRRRKDVTEDYERCIKEIQSQCDQNIGPADPDNPPAVDTPGGLLRVWRIPQVYNFRGKGLSGFWTDSASRLTDDFRNEDDNNDHPNYPKGKYNPNPREVPTDSGGVR